MNIKTTLKTSVAAAALFAVAAPVASPADAADDTLKSGNKNSLTVSGYVAKAAWYADDGVDEQLFLTDGGTSETRVRWVAKGTVNENVTAGAFIEIELLLSNRQASSSLGAAGNTFGQGETNADSANNGFNDVRHQFVWVNHKKFGKLSLGNTDAAANGNMEANLGGLGYIDLSSATAFGDGIRFVNDTVAGSESRSATTASAAITNLDFTSRTDVIRYDTPTFMGLRLTASLDGGGGGEVGGRYNGKFGQFRVKAHAGYSELSSKGNNDYIVGGSVAVLHDSGLNASFAGGKRPLDLETPTTARTPSFFYGSVGYKAKIFKIGGTNFQFGYNNSHGIALKGDRGEAFNFTVGQDITPIGAKVAFFYNKFQLERKRTTAGTGGKESFDDIDLFGVVSIFNF